MKLYFYDFSGIFSFLVQLYRLLFTLIRLIAPVPLIARFCAESNPEIALFWWWWCCCCCTFNKIYLDCESFLSSQMLNTNHSNPCEERDSNVGAVSKCTKWWFPSESTVFLLDIGYNTNKVQSNFTKSSR